MPGLDLVRLFACAQYSASVEISRSDAARLDDRPTSEEERDRSPEAGGAAAGRSLRDLLPHGGGLEGEAWTRRHRAIVLLLWLHVPPLAVAGFIWGLDPTHVVLESAILAVAALVAGQTTLTRPARMVAASFGLASASAILVHFSGGYIEMHFHFFVVVVIVSLYQHWLPFLFTVAYVALHHGVLGALHPSSVFNHPDAIAHPWKWASIHAGFILAESVAAVYAWRQSETAQAEARVVTERLVAERVQLRERTAALALLQGVASAANEASLVDEAIEAALTAVCSYTDWPVGHAYLVVPQGPVAKIVDTGIWHTRRADDRVREFQRVTNEMQLVPGVGLAGRVVELGSAMSIPKLAADENFIRKDAAAQAGLVSAIAFPILAGTDVAGVLEFFGDVPCSVDTDMLSRMDQVGAQLGRVIERRRASDSLRASEERTRSIVETANDAFVGMDEAGVITEWNRRAESMFGWSALEAIGREVASLILPPGDDRAGGPFGSARSGTPVGQRVETSAMRRDGTVFPVEITAWATSSGERASFNAFIQDISERARSQAELEEAYASVSESARALEQRNREVTLIGEMGELLQSCETLDEAYEVVGRYGDRLFPGDTGALYSLAASRNIVELVASWGAPLRDEEKVFAPSACWGLRRGRLHQVDAETGLACGHVQADVAAGAMCIPMVAQSDTLGILHLRGDGVAASAGGRQLALAMAEHLSLSLANFRLRASLRAQSIRDPLTGLYNRRYLEESLDRELRRAARSSRPVSVVSIDIDHFKRFNDTFGNAAGDAVLAAVGRLLLEHVRDEDIACRMGGEELVLILPDCSLEVASQRAEQVRHLVRDLIVAHNGQPLGRITISLGVAVFPDHGTTPDRLLIAADDALYTAKAAGRDRTALSAVS